jgi:apolipoprotein N-acyltransferase
MIMSFRNDGIGRSSIFLALLSGTLLFLSFPKYGTGLAAWIAFIPLLHVLRATKTFHGFLAGFVAGLIAHVGLIHWIAYVVVNYGYLPLPVGIAVMMLLSAYLALYVALFSAGVVFFNRRGISPVIAAPLLWTSLEYAKSHFLTGFPWVNLGYSQYSYTYIVQIADITGVFGVSFVIVLVNALIYDALVAVWMQRNRKQSGRRAVMRIVACGILVFALVVYGIYRTRDIDRSVLQAPQLPVSLVQGNIDQGVKWHPGFQHETIQIYKKLTLQAAPAGGGLIVWPETATPFFFQDQDEMHREVVSLPLTTGSRLLFGSPSYERDVTGIVLRNSAYLLSADGRIAGRYDKVHLVPYGEYVPLRRFFPFIRKLTAGIGDFQRGAGYEPLTMHGTGPERKLGVMICYEGILPEAGRAYRRKEASLLVNITNDAWFGDTSAPHQHLSMTTFRSVENRMYTVRAANTGISAIIDPAGRIISRTNLFERTTIQGAVRFMSGNTLYAASGDVFVYGCILALILIFVRSKKNKERQI